MTTEHKDLSVAASNRHDQCGSRLRVDAMASSRRLVISWYSQTATAKPCNAEVPSTFEDHVVMFSDCVETKVLACGSWLR